MEMVNFTPRPLPGKKGTGDWVSSRARLDIFESGIRTPDCPVSCLVTISTTLTRQLTKCQQPILFSYCKICETSHANKQTHTHTHTHTKLRGLSPHANYTDRAAAAGRRS